MYDRKFKEPSWETDKILWRNRQWAVTSYGIENVAGPYHYYIDANKITQAWLNWPEHMREKNWVDEEMFDECYTQAVKIHGKETVHAAG